MKYISSVRKRHRWEELYPGCDPNSCLPSPTAPSLTGPHSLHSPNEKPEVGRGASRAPPPSGRSWPPLKEQTAGGTQHARGVHSLGPMAPLVLPHPAKAQWAGTPHLSFPPRGSPHDLSKALPGHTAGRPPGSARGGHSQRHPRKTLPI